MTVKLEYVINNLTKDMLEDIFDGKDEEALSIYRNEVLNSEFGFMNSDTDFIDEKAWEWFQEDPTKFINKDELGKLIIKYIDGIDDLYDTLKTREYCS